MSKRILLGISMLLLTAINHSVSAQSWVLLGSAKVNGAGVDHDQILVTAKRGEFTAIKLMVENEGIEFERVVVHFGNGEQTELKIRDFIHAGGETRVLDLPGHNRLIRQVDFYYSGNPATKRKGKVVLYGRR